MDAANHPRMTLSRGLLTAIIVVASAAALAAVVYAALWIGDIQRAFTVNVAVATPLDLTPTVQGSIGESTVAYDTVVISSYEPLTGARVQLALAVALRFAVFIAACAVIIMLAARLWRGRPFVAAASVMLGALGLFAGVVAFAAPWLQASGTTDGVTALGFPLSGDSAGGDLAAAEWIVPPSFAVQDTDWLLLGFGLVLCLVAALVLHGRRLQRDTEGLV